MNRGEKETVEQEKENKQILLGINKIIDKSCDSAIMTSLKYRKK